MLKLNFVTTNSLKFAVAQNFFKQAGLIDTIELKQHNQETPEIQADTVEEIALSSAKWIGDQLQEPVVVADAGLSITALKGFPGPYMKYVNSKLTPKQIIALMSEESDRSAEFIDALAYYDPKTGTSQVFTSTTLRGSIATDLASSQGYMIDQLFIPEGHNVSLAELSEEDRTTIWDTSRWKKLMEFLRAKEK